MSAAGRDGSAARAFLRAGSARAARRQLRDSGRFPGTYRPCGRSRSSVERGRRSAAAAIRSRVWLPLPLAQTTAYQRLLAQRWTASTQELRPRADEIEPRCSWPRGAESASARTLTLTCTDRNHALSRRARTDERFGGIDSGARAVSRADRADPDRRHRRGDGARDHQGAHATPLAKARAIYDWIVDNTFRDPEVKGCGLGDIRGMLE